MVVKVTGGGRIRAGQGKGVRIPMIAMTANAISGDREMGLRQGMDDYISKPISIANLAEVLERWAPRGQAGAALAEAAIPPHQQTRHEQQGGAQADEDPGNA